MHLRKRSLLQGLLFCYHNFLSLSWSVLYNYESVYSFYKSAGYLQFTLLLSTLYE